jgi:pentatricopeptide repeat protein
MIRMRVSKLHGFLQNLFLPSPHSTKTIHSSQSSPPPPVPSSREYMRNVIGNIYITLKYSSWDFAQLHLQNLPLKWDSYTVNQVLKSHPPMEKAWLFFNWASRIKGFKHDQFTCTTMLDIFGEAGRISSMKHVFNQMQDKGIKIDSVTYTSMMHWLSTSGNVDEAIALWNEMKSKGCCYPTVVSYTAFIKILFDNCYTYTVLMDHLIASG